MADLTTTPPPADTSTVNSNYNPQSIGPGNTPIINSDTLTPQQPITPIQPNPTSPYPIQNIQLPNTDLQPTSQEQQQTTLSQQLQQLNTGLEGKSAYTAQQNDVYGVPKLVQSQNDLTAQIKALQGQSQNLQNMASPGGSIENQAQQYAQGRGETAAGLAPMQTAALRNNQIQQSSITSQALTATAALNAVQGNLATAQYYVTQAVDNKFDPIQEQITALTSNLDLIKNDPSTSLADKNRATQQQLALNQQAAQLAVAKQNALDVQTETLKYAGIATAQQLAAMQKASSGAEVAQIAAAYGLQQPMANRYQQTSKTITDAFGNQTVLPIVFDTVLHRYLSSAETSGKTAEQMNNQSSGGIAGSSTSGTPNSNPQSNTNTGLSFDQYGLLSKTNFNPSNTVDQLAQKYLDSYIKNGTVPTASSLGRSIKPGAVAQLDARARDLYFQATGQSMPTPEIIKGYQQQLIGNNKLLNNLNVQEGTIGKNATLLIQNLNENNLNQSLPAINSFIDNVRNMLGDPNVAQFLAQNATVSNELGSLLSLKNAQGTTVHDKLEAAGIIGKGDSTAQISSKVKILLQEAVNAHDAIQSANAELYKQTDPLMQDANNPLRTQTKNSAFVDKSLSTQGLHYDALVAEMKPQAPTGTQPALDAKTGKPVFATPAEIQAGAAIPL